jgi:hypothetical protein
MKTKGLFAKKSNKFKKVTASQNDSAFYGANFRLRVLAAIHARRNHPRQAKRLGMFMLWRGGGHSGMTLLEMP